jgi:biotin transport system substrate-specific component
VKWVYDVDRRMSVDTESVELVGDETTKNLARAVVFAALTAATAPVEITSPLVPQIPFTLQTLWVFLAGVVLGPAWGGLAFGLYVLTGLAGLPVFNDGGGLNYIFSDTGGYLVGFVAAAVVVGYVVHGTGDLRDPTTVSVPRLAAAIAAGTVVIWAAGGLWLVAGGYLGVAATLKLTTTFLPGSLLKAAVAVGVVKSDAIVAR